MSLSQVLLLSGSVILFLTLILLFVNRLEILIRIYVPRLIRREKERPQIEHVISTREGYRVFVKLPESITSEQFIAKKEVLENYLNCNVTFESHQDVLLMDVKK